jgi:hypothetical protein
MTFTTDPEELISIIPCFFIRFHSRALKRLALLATRYGSFERHLGGIADKCTDAAASYLSVIAPFARSCLTLTKEGEVELEAQVGIGPANEGSAASLGWNAKYRRSARVVQMRGQTPMNKASPPHQFRLDAV